MPNKYAGTKSNIVIMIHMPALIPIPKFALTASSAGTLVSSFVVVVDVVTPDPYVLITPEDPTGFITLDSSVFDELVEVIYVAVFGVLIA